MPTSTRFSCLALVAAIALSGCGGDDEKSAAPATNATDQGFVAKADAICAEGNKKEAALGAPGPGWIYEKQFDDREFLVAFNAVGRTTLRGLRQLRPPADQREAFTTVVESIDRMVRALDARIAGLKARKRDPSTQVNSYYSAYSDLAAAAGRLGFTECQGVLL